MNHASGGSDRAVTASSPLGSRAAAALRFGASVGVSAAMTGLLFWLLPRRLSVVTDIVGLPIHSNFNYQPYFWRYYLAVLFAPALATAVYHLIGVRRPDWRWPDSVPPPAPQAASEAPARTLVLEQALRAVAVGATFGLGLTLVDPRGPTRFWVDLAGVALAYAAVVLGVAALASRSDPTVQRFAEATARLNALATPFTVASLLAASRATRVIVASDGSVHAYPWLPAWAAAAAIALLLSVTIARSRRAYGLTAVRRIEAQTILLVAVPIVLWLYTAGLPLALGWLDSFHIGEFIAGAWLFHAGAFPWRDLLFIHGLLQDIFTPAAGFKLFGDSVWGGCAGFSMLLIPLWWTTMYFFFVYLFRRNTPLLLAAATVPVLEAFMDGHSRFAPLPLILLALAALLERATWPRAFLLALALLVSNVLVPELAYAVPACGAALVGFELTQRRRGLGFLANLPRTVRVTAAGSALLALWLANLAHHQAAAAFLDYYRAFAPGHALTGAMPHLKELRFLVFMFLPPVLVLLAFWYAVAAVRMRWVLDVRDWVMAALALVTFLYYPKFLSRADWHVMQAVSPALPLLYYAVHKILPLCGMRSRRGLVAAGGVAVLAALSFTWGHVAENLSRVPANFIRVVPNRPVLDELGWSEPDMASQAAGWTDLRDFLDAVLDPGDTLFDFTNQPAIYHYLLRRKPATRYYHVSMAIRRSVQLDLVKELERTRPKLVVFDTDSGGLPEWDGVTNEVRHYEVSRYILRRYRPFARVRGQVF
jgi:hypothetical protein